MLLQILWLQVNQVSWITILTKTAVIVIINIDALPLHLLVFTLCINEYMYVIIVLVIIF